MKNIFKITFGFLLLSVITFYLGIVFLLPQIINSKIIINKLQSIIHDKTGIETNIIGLNLKISPKLIAVLNVDSIDAKNKHVTVVDIKKFSINYMLLQKNLTSISASNIYIDGNSLKQFKKTQKNKKSNKFELKNLPEINIKNLVYKSDEISIYTKNINTEKDTIHLNIDVKTPYLKETLKLGYSGSLQVIENKLKANKLEIKLGNSNLYVDGYLVNKDKVFDFDLKGKNLPVYELVPIILHLQKTQDPTKKFIENFKNFKGTISVNLKVNKDGIWGKCVADNLGAKAVWFDIPVFFKEAIFNFRGKTIDSVAEGILGNEKVIHTLNVTKLGTPEKAVVGKVNTKLTKNFNFVPNLTVLNTVNINLVYKIKERKPDVYYNIDIPEKSDLIYNSFYLGLRNSKRKIYANTFKDNHDLYLKEYKYSYIDSGRENTIISGNGLFVKNIDKSDLDKFIPQYITCHTNGYAPISVTGSFGEKVRGGEFKGDLKYDFVNNQVLGTFDIIKARHQAFKIEKAHIITKNGVFNIISNGLYKGEKYSAELSAKNNIYGETLIYNMKLFLDKLVFETTPDTHKHNKKIDSKEFSKKVKNSDITINNWEIAINKIIRDKFVLDNVKLIGSLKNGIFDFNMKDLNFADGTVHAKGLYNFNKDTSEITFEAKNINSNKAAEMTVNLKDQIEGIANVKVELNGKNMFKFLDAHCDFEVKEGFMPGLADKEFTFKNNKYKFSEITNVDLKKKDLMKDDIKGTFDVHNTELNNINITTWHELSAMYLEGNYEMEKQIADIQLFWKYSKDAPKGIRIFFVPLSLILKFAFKPENSKELYKSKFLKVPDINANEKNTSYYRMHLKGDVNNNKVDLLLKEIK